MRSALLAALTCFAVPAAAQTGGEIARDVNLAALNTTPGAFDPARVSFEADVQDLRVDLRRFYAIALPGEVVEIEVAQHPSEGRFAFEANGFEAVEGPRTLAAKAPAEPGAYPVTVTSPEGETMTITVFVMAPASAVVDGEIEGYRIGAYPSEPLRGLDSYLAPEGYMRMPPELYDYALSPHFRLGQFVSKQGGSQPVKYLLVRPEIVLKLEELLRAVNEEGIRADSFYVMSGYRTPHYNAELGNVLYSRHQWGDAADIYVDRDGDFVMDDIDGDGAILRRDAGRLYEIAERVDELEALAGVRGGVGEYGANAAHGPFVHVDTRGTPARWGRK